MLSQQLTNIEAVIIPLIFVLKITFQRSQFSENLIFHNFVKKRQRFPI